MAKTETKTPSRLPIRVSLSGIVILMVFLGFLNKLLRSSIYASLLFEIKPTGQSLSLLQAATCAASFLNVVSHSAVALGVLNDTYVLSILVGVGFDVFTRILQMVWWMSITVKLWSTTANESPDSTLSLLTVLTLMYVYHLIVHVQALNLNHSLERMQSVLESSINNLRGIPGRAYVDHLFAYTDLGTHMFCWGFSAWSLQKEGKLWIAMMALGILLGISHWVFSFIPFSEMPSARSIASLIIIQETKISCSCRACMRKRDRRIIHQNPVSFTVNPSDGICQLWLGSFEQLSGILASATKP